MVSLQFLVGTEVLIILAIEAAIALVLVIVFVAYQNPGVLRARAQPSLVGLSVALATSVVLLSVPGLVRDRRSCPFFRNDSPGLEAKHICRIDQRFSFSGSGLDARCI